jgi:hypothetical protein
MEVKVAGLIWILIFCCLLYVYPQEYEHADSTIQ